MVKASPAHRSFTKRVFENSSSFDVYLFWHYCDFPDRRDSHEVTVTFQFHRACFIDICFISRQYFHINPHCLSDLNQRLEKLSVIMTGG